MGYVRTFTGAWIETAVQTTKLLALSVRTFTGAWIETLIGSSKAFIK